MIYTEPKSCLISLKNIFLAITDSLKYFGQSKNVKSRTIMTLSTQIFELRTLWTARISLGLDSSIKV